MASVMNHERAKHWETTEARLAYSQLILALQRIPLRGTLIMLLHKADLWPHVFILYTFSNSQNFKPVKKHGTRSSFYMIAKDVEPTSYEAKASVHDRKDVWWKATFVGIDGLGMKEEREESFVLRVFNEFGDRLLELDRRMWRT